MENNPINNKAPWWRDGVIIFTKVSAYIAGPIILASFIGKYFDEKYSRENFYFYISVALAFTLTIYLIWREMKLFKKKVEKDNNQEIK